MRPLTRRTARLDNALAERLLAGPMVGPTVPAPYRELAAVLAALRSPPTDRELAAQPTLAELRAETGRAVDPAPLGRLRRIAARLWIKTSACLALGVVTTGGVAVAAGADHEPRPNPQVVDAVTNRDRQPAEQQGQTQVSTSPRRAAPAKAAESARNQQLAKPDKAEGDRSASKKENRHATARADAGKPGKGSEPAGLQPPRPEPAGRPDPVGRRARAVSARSGMSTQSAI